MSRRKREAIEAAHNSTATTQSVHQTKNQITWRQRAKSVRFLVLLALIVAAGAAVAVGYNFFGFSSGSSPSSLAGGVNSNSSVYPRKSKAPTSSNNSNTGSTSSTTNAPQLSKEYVYAGGSRLLAVEEPGLPDLKVVRITAAPELSAAGKRYRFMVEFKNTSGAATPNVWIGVVLLKENGQCFYQNEPGNNNCVWGGVQRSVAAGETVVVTMSPTSARGGYWYPPASGTHTIKAWVDDHNNVSEPNEQDNILMRTVNVNVPNDLVVWRQTSGEWWMHGKAGIVTQVLPFGQLGDKPLPADFDGDGYADFCVYRPNSPQAGLGQWWIQSSNSNTTQVVQFGLSSDTPVPADYDGDGRADIAVWRSSSKTFYVLASSTNTVRLLTATAFMAEDTPVPADYDGDGLVDAAVRRGNMTQVFILRSSDNQLETVAYGSADHKQVIGDFDGDGRFDVALRIDAFNQWHVLKSSNGQTLMIDLAMQAADVSVAGDYDGDGKTDAAVWRPSNGTWYIRKSSDNQMRVEQWGTSGDVPVPAPMKR